LEEADWQEEDLSSSQPTQPAQSQLPESLFLHHESDELMVSTLSLHFSIIVS
jgi:hypothetical protein